MNAITHQSRPHAFLSASSSARWSNCPASAAAESLYPNNNTPEAAEGTLAHEVAETIARNRVFGEALKPFPAGTDKNMVKHATAYAEYLASKLTTPEAILLLEQRVDFSHIVPEGFGTADAVIVDGNKLVIVDYKYGRIQVSAVNNSQMRLYAAGAVVMWSQAYNIEFVETCIFQPRIQNITSELLTVNELNDWTAKLESTAVLAANGVGGYATGTYCRNCTHAIRCPSMFNLIYETAHCLDNVQANVLCLSPEAIADILTIEPVLTAVLKRIKDYALTTLLKTGDSIPGWKVVEGKPGNRKWKDEKNAFHILKKAGFDSTDLLDIHLRSPAQIEKSIGTDTISDLINTLCTRSPGSPSLTKNEDSRPSLYTMANAIDDYN